MIIFIEDEKKIEGHKVRGIITIDAIYQKFSDAADIEDILVQAEKIIAALIPKNCHAVATDSTLNTRRGSNQRVDLQKMKFRSN